MLSFFRVLKFSIQDILRNFSLSVMTIFVLILMLLSVDALVVVQVLTNRATSSIEDKIDVTVYFHHDATSEQIEEVKQFVGSFPEVVSIEYSGVEEVLAEFKEFHKDNPDILASLEELDENPLGATMVVKTRQPSDYAHVISALQIPEYETIIEAKSFSDTQKAIDRIHLVTTHVERFTILFCVLFVIIAFFIIFNTVRVTIFTQRVEISVKKLVGATNWFIGGPYIVSALVFTVFSVAASYAIALFFVGVIDPYIAVVFEDTTILTNYFLSHILFIAGTQFFAVLILTVFSSLIAMRKYLHV